MNTRSALCLLALWLLFTSSTQAAEVEKAPDIEERVQVIGSPTNVEEIAGSAHYLGEEELERQQQSDIQRILTLVPGVYFQDEEGYGLRPNIGMRGTGVERSQKVTLMEDGVLIAPAPYAAPSAYYFPTAGRMSAIEVSKGPSSIRQGPRTNGGVLNMVSSEIPREFGGRFELALGEDAAVRNRFLAGDAGEYFGWLVESFREQTDGFKDLDGGGSTGYDLEDYMVKLRLQSGDGSGVYQAVEVKLGRTDQDGDETYLGLTPADFDADPFRRYVASGEDEIRTDHEQVQLRYFVVPNSFLDLTTTLYYNDFYRNWYKLQSVDGNQIGKILDDPATFSHEMDLIRGEVDSGEDDGLFIRANSRDYYSRGLQSVLGIRVGDEGARHDIEVGLRVHEDQEDRYQQEDEYDIVRGALSLTALGDPGSQSNRIADADAMAFFVRDRLSFGNWTLSPGIRFETIDYERRDFGKSDPLRSGADLVIRDNDVDEWIPGIGVDYRVGPGLSVFVGAHKGFSPPGPGSDDSTDPEESVNYEMGARYAGDRKALQAVAFFNDYDNLLGTDTLSSGGEGTGETFNGGKAEVYGFEVSLNGDAFSGRKRSVPYRVAYTYSHGEFENSFLTTFADWAPAVDEGDELPYLPEQMLSAGAGLRQGNWSVYLDASYVDEMRTKSGSGDIREDERIEDHLVFDSTADYRFHRHYRVFLRVRNLTDEEYVAARRPAGLRPGLSRTLLAGFDLTF